MNISNVLNVALESGELKTLSVLGGSTFKSLPDKEGKPFLSSPLKNSNCGRKVTITTKVTPWTELILEEDTLSTISSYLVIQKMLQKETGNDTNTSSHSNL